MTRAFALALALSGAASASTDGGTHALLGQLTLLLLVAAFAAYLSFRAGLVPIIGFLLAGVLVGPSVLGVIDDPALISTASEIGVMLLLFAIGIEFSLERLARIGRAIFLGGGAQVALTVAATTLLLTLLGVSVPNALFTGCLLALSSTAIVMKLLADRGRTGSEAGQLSLAVLIFQDLAVVVMVLLVPMMAGQGGGPLGVLLALAKAGGIVAAVLLLARRVLPKLLEVVARTCSPEIFLLTIVAVCFGTAYLTSLAGVSLALGAFLAGLIVSESRFGRQALGEILPLQILFSAAFFLSVGLQLDVRFLLTNLPLVLLAVVLIAVLKTAVTAASLRLLGTSTLTATATALLLAQIGEFSFVLESTGRALGLTPAGLGERGTQTFIAATVLLMAFTPLLARLGERLPARTPRPAPAPAAPDTGHGPLGHLRDHVILAGFGAHARRVARALHRQHQPFGVLTLSPGGAADVAEHDVPVVIGDYARAALLSEAGVAHARALVVADDAPDMAARVISVARTLNPDLTIVAHVDRLDDADELRHAGATHVLTGHDEVALGVLHHLTPGEPGRAHLHRALHGPLPVALDADQLGMCEHTAQTTCVTPEADVCPECVALGDRWVHLRVCMTCGHVGCCDSSKNKHATAHHHASGHPIIRSLERGETWAYCYPHDLTK
ncbi:cation:proton antiporter [Deinococcus maricopensis]|uniref:Sodium/hydrogen exchanger n=1 Tax=Deinococcus maricopensis (strain DSM 21211 / LMG 22137 / NRRL B-23946 / LB-34) TaxID=709986 RepID=E8U6F7_DEIML|nr:cation:proton antiporter [Deinococcus maricopensis]ADV66646.1 sodium/hydrogen exchanger [Deinococcus maricopensis DSM 21211]